MNFDAILRKKEKYVLHLRNQYKGASVLVAMSGGVDSSVAAFLLAEAGLKVIGVHFRLIENSLNQSKGCCHTGSAIDVQRVCDRIGASSYVWNLTNQFQSKVIEYFENSYFHGETPNPCIECNRELKWGEMWKRKLSLGIDFIATGHYARMIQIYGKKWIARATDYNKDQSYALWVIPEEKRDTTIFPLGIFRKSEIRTIANFYHLPTAHTPESQDICFLAGSDYRTWLAQRKQSNQSGWIRDSSGRIVGQHSGIFNYTIGQRKGLGGGFSEPQYVIETRLETSEVIIGDLEQLYFKEIVIRDVIGIIPKQPVLVQVRYKDKGVLANAIPLENNGAKVIFFEPVRAPAIGQSAVGYIGDRLVFGGIIHQIDK
ncbi:MAG: tRNA 2-thiouridine(34) synthase MnmA [bacterium]|nr:tRNA 2-thiouridine(34) synthase MnmA [bacterium]